MELAEAGDVERITIDEDGRVDGELADGTPFETAVPTALARDELLETLLDEGVAVAGPRRLQHGAGVGRGPRQ